MIINKIKAYLNERPDITFREFSVELDSCNIEELIERHSIRVYAPVDKNNIFPLHYLNELEEFASRFYNDLKTFTGIENLKFLGLNVESKVVKFPKIIYKNSVKQTYITIKVDDKEIKKIGTYIKELDIEFF